VERSELNTSRFLPVIALTIFVVLVVLVRQAQFLAPDMEVPERALTLLSVAVLLLGAWLTGVLMESVGLPRICGYILFGMLIGPSPYALGLLPTIDHVQKDLQFVNYLAISLIAFLAGGEIKLDWLRGQFRKVITLVGVDVLIVITGSVLVILLFAPLMPFLKDEPFLTQVIVSALVALVIITNSPAIAIAMISDYRAEGPLTQTTLALTVVKDIVVILLFTTVLTLGKGVLFADGAVSLWFLLGVSIQLIGSLLIGAFVGLLMAIYVERVRAALAIFIVACCLLFALLGEQYFLVAGNYFHFEPLLMALAAGVFMENLYPKSSRPLFHRMEELSLPVYCMFFALAGAKVDLASFATLWYICLALAVLRASLIYTGVYLGRKAAGYTEEWSRHIWFGLLPQAGVSLVLIALIMQSFVEFAWGQQISYILLGMVVINELFGPIGFRYALFNSGEAKVGKQK